MKLSDYVVHFLKDFGTRDVFLLAGGGIMHLLDSLAKEKDIHKYYNLHEQASGFAADGYAQYSNKLGVVFATTGPGATNVVTSLASAFIDSTPLLVISGQVKRASITTLAGVRQTGAQEVGIIPIVSSVTKYAVTVMNPEDIRFALEKAVYLATTGRPGTVWLDIPLDVQAAEIDPKDLRSFTIPSKEQVLVKPEAMKSLLSLLKFAKRPCILAGTGVMLAGAREVFGKLVEKMQIPVVTSRRARRIFRQPHDRYFYGSAGMVAPRYANYVLQNADVLLVLGSGLRYYLTAYNDAGFAPLAKKILVNIAEPEIDKFKAPVDLKIVCDARAFIEGLLQEMKDASLPAYPDWRSYCDAMREKYPAEKEVLSHEDGLTDGYLVSEALNRYARHDDIYVASPSAFAYGYNIFHLHDQQDYVCPVGLGSMGTGLPFAIGVCVASGKRVLLGEGDGSLQHNIQELALLREYQLPLKVFIDNNHEYRQIYTMQQTHFQGRLAGCTKKSGLGMPDLQKIAAAYDLRYFAIEKAENTDKIVQEALADDEPALIDVFSSPQTEFVPIIKSRMEAEGKMLSSKLEDLYPFLPEAEQKANMIGYR